MSITRNLAILTSRTVVGGYLAAHGAQKLFGSFGGHGIEATATNFDHLGLSPSGFMARVAAISELAGGALTAAGAAYPVGPVAIAGTMAVAASAHGSNGPFAANGGYELPLAFLAAAVGLGAVGPGKLSLDGLTHWEIPASVRIPVILGAAVASAISMSMIMRAPAPSTVEPIAARGEEPTA